EYFSSGPDKTLPLKRTHARHLPIVGDTLDPRTMVRFQNNPSLRNDGNDVNVDYEMSQQADTSIRYQLFSDLIGRKFSGLKEIIKTR
ncbi:MAG: flagellar basal body rod protein FlgB, partial [Deferribacterales bacterium]|nr:flagellar basal body rod protein FlgB [Deferribacterales bacterium]